LADNSCKVTLEGHSRQIWWLAWSPDSKHIVTGRQIACAAAAAIVAAWRASGSEDTTARVWNVEYDRCWFVQQLHSHACLCACRTGEVKLCLSGHRGGVFRVAYSPDGSLIGQVPRAVTSPHWARLSHSTGSIDKSCILWDASSGVLLHQLIGHKHTVAVKPLHLHCL